MFWILVIVAGIAIYKWATYKSQSQAKTAIVETYLKEELPEMVREINKIEEDSTAKDREIRDLKRILKDALFEFACAEYGHSRFIATSVNPIDPGRLLRAQKRFSSISEPVAPLSDQELEEYITDCLERV